MCDARRRCIAALAVGSVVHHAFRDVRVHVPKPSLIGTDDPVVAEQHHPERMKDCKNG